MVQYIDKDALVAWAKETYLCENASMVRKVCYKQLLEHLDTIEVKEVDLEKELEEWIKYGPHTNYPWCTIPDAIKITAEHFFELGISVSNKAQKGE